MDPPSQQTSTIVNPILPGWNPDPSCIFVPAWDNTFFCVTSSFLAFPGLPLYASKDLQNWKHVTNIFNRETQVPEIGHEEGQNNGIFAPTLRFHSGKFYVIVEYVTIADPPIVFGLIFSSTNPYEASSWSDPVVFCQPENILDPDLFWDDDGKLYVQAGSFLQNIVQFDLDIETGVAGPTKVLWEGTGQLAPEGPHMYKKDGWYYLLISEGGTDLPHCLTIARSLSPRGPFNSFENNPILTNRDTSEYFQTVGHGDLFQDGSGVWWGVALATRSGPAFKSYPMGRETVLFPVIWETEEWPQLEPVRGRIAGWPLPPTNLQVQGGGDFVGKPDVVDFQPGSELPLHFVYWKFPPVNSFTVSPPDRPNTLGIRASKANLAGTTGDKESDSISVIFRRQTSTLFSFSVDIQFNPTREREEVGTTVFLTQKQHISLGLVLLPTKGNQDNLALHLRFQLTTAGSTSTTSNISLLPAEWTNSDQPIRLHIKTTSEFEYTFFATLPSVSSERILGGTAPATVVSGQTGPWTGKQGS